MPKMSIGEKFRTCAKSVVAVAACAVVSVVSDTIFGQKWSMSGILSSAVSGSLSGAMAVRVGMKEAVRRPDDFITFVFLLTSCGVGVFGNVAASRFLHNPCSLNMGSFYAAIVGYDLGQRLSASNGKKRNKGLACG